MTLPWTDAFEAAAVRCGLCHDQCVSACPVVGAARTQQAYPSRLATLARLLAQGKLEPSPAAMEALQYCIHCNACTANCVYLDQPVDVTPLVRWARASLVEKGFATGPVRELIEKETRFGNPYGDIRGPLEALIRETPAAAACEEGCTLVLPDAYGLLYDPGAAVSAVKLLDRLGYPQVSVSRTATLGWELWQYGYPQQAARITQALIEEIERVQPSAVVPLSPAGAALLRQVVPLPCPVLTLPEAVLEKIRSAPLRLDPKGEKACLVLTYAETCQLKSLAAREVLLQGGAKLTGVPALQPYSWMSFPEGPRIGVDPDPGLYQVERLAARAKREHADSIVCTEAQAVQAFRQTGHGLPVYDWASYVLSSTRKP